MRDRIVFFILGALLATLAYFAGDMQLSAHNTETDERELISKLFVEDLMVKQLLVQEIVATSIRVGHKGDYRIRMEANGVEGSICLFHPNGEKNISLTLGRLPHITGPEAAYLSIFSPNGKQNIALCTNNEIGSEGLPFISIRDDTGKTRLMDTSSVNRFAKP